MHTTLPAGTVPAARGLTNPFLSPKRIAAHRRHGKGTGEMTSIQKTLEDVAKTMTKQVTTVLAEAGKKHGVTITDALLEDVLVGLGLVELKITVKKTKSVSSDGEKTRKRVVSKKMKEAYLALEGGNEENLKEAMKAYKDAPEVESFEAFSRARLGLAPEDKPKKEEKKKEKTEKPKAEKKEKKEKTGRFDKWTPTSTKLFKTIVEESGGVVSDELKKELVVFIDGLSDEDFAGASIQGHMRSFITTKFVKKDDPPADDTAEEQEEFDFEGETLWIGVKTGKIFRQTDEAGDVLIGYAGKGRFKDVSKPENEE